MKKTIVTLACCALIAPLAFAQTRSTSKRHTATTTEAVTVTGETITAIEEGAISRALMFSTGLVTLWTRREQ